jgi:hypothetical protein
MNIVLDVLPLAYRLPALFVPVRTNELKQNSSIAILFYGVEYEQILAVKI